MCVCMYVHVCTSMFVCIYLKHEKIRWAKHSQIQSNEVFAGKLLQCLTFKILKQCRTAKLICIQIKIHRKTFMVLLRTLKV